MAKDFLKTILSLAALAVLSLPACGHHHGGGSSPPSPAPNPAAYTYTARVVAQHQPGFFSCWNLGGLFLGTYMDYSKSDMQAQLCKLEGNHIRVLWVAKGAESIYNIRPIDDKSMFLACEQWRLFGSDTNGHVWTIHPKHLGMGHYQGQWWHHDGIAEWVTTEKDTVSTSNKSQVWVENKLLYQSSDFTWKEFVIKGNKIYLAVYFVWKHIEGGILEVDLKTGEANLLYHQPGTACYCIGIHRGMIVYGLQHGPTTTMRTLNGPFQEIPDIAWRLRSVGDTLFLTCAEHGWRKGGPSYLYVLNPQSGQFEKKLQLDCCEPWDICQGPSGNQFYLVSRCEKGNVGKIYLIERH